MKVVKGKSLYVIAHADRREPIFAIDGDGPLGLFHTSREEAQREAKRQTHMYGVNTTVLECRVTKVKDVGLDDKPKKARSR